MNMAGWQGWQGGHDEYGHSSVSKGPGCTLLSMHDVAGGSAGLMWNGGPGYGILGWNGGHGGSNGLDAPGYATRYGGGGYGIRMQQKRWVAGESRYAEMLPRVMEEEELEDGQVLPRLPPIKSWFRD